MVSARRATFDQVLKVTDLFTTNDTDLERPLADRMRPAALAEFYGQQHLLAEG